MSPPRGWSCFCDGRFYNDVAPLALEKAAVNALLWPAEI